MKSKNKSTYSSSEKHLEDMAKKVQKEEMNNIVDQLNKGSLELFPTTIAGYYLNRDGTEIINDILNEEQHNAVMKFREI